MSHMRKIQRLACLTLIALLGVSAIGGAQEDTWTRKADMPTARAGLGASVIDGRIYAIGGWTEISEVTRTNNVSSSVQVYDPATDMWMQKADMPTPRSGSWPWLIARFTSLGGSTG